MLLVNVSARIRHTVANLALGVLVGAGVPAFAVDGVIEINQAKALAGGVTAGDSPGFPVHLNQPGSYRLTGDLTGAPGFDGVVVGANNVTLDLNGFNVVGAAGGIADGISLAGFRNIEIRNGTVRGFSRTGIFTNINTHDVRLIGVRAVGNVIGGIDLQGGGNLVQACAALSNLGVGIRALDGSLVIDSVARGNSSLGLSMGTNTGFRSNVLTDNNGGNANPQSSGGLQLGSNVCGSDLVCP